MATELGAGYISLTVSADKLVKQLGKDVGDGLAKQLDKGLKDAGKDQAQQFTETFEKVAKPRAKKTGAEIKQDLVEGAKGTGKEIGADVEKGVDDGAQAAALKLADRMLKNAKQIGKKAGVDLSAELEAVGKVGDSIKAKLEAALREAGKEGGKKLADAVEAEARGSDAGKQIDNAVVSDTKATGKKVGDRIADDVEQSGDGAGSGWVKNFGTSALAKIGAVATTIGTTVATAVAGAAAIGGGLLAKGVSDAFGAESAGARLGAQLGLDPAQQERIGKIAGGVYRDAYGESIEEVGDITARLLQTVPGLFEGSNEAIATSTKRLIDIATISGEDSTRILQAASQLVANDLAPNIYDAFDVITRGFQNGANRSEDFLDTIIEYSPFFEYLGINGAEALGMINQGLAAGARNSDYLGDAIKGFSIRAVDGSKLTAEAMTELGFDAETMAQRFAAGGDSARDAFLEVTGGLRSIEDPVKRSQLAVALFGTKSEDLVDALLAMDPATAVGAAGLENLGGTAERMGDQLNDTAAVKIEAFKRQALGALADFTAQYVIPQLERFGAFFQAEILPELQRFGAWFEENGIPALQRFYGWLKDNVIPVLGEAAAWVRDTLIPALGDLGAWIRDDLVPALETAWQWFSVNIIPILEDARDRFVWLGDEIEEAWEVAQTTLIPALEQLWGVIEEDLIPALDDMVEIYRRDVQPVMQDVARVAIDIFGKALVWVILQLTEMINLSVQTYNALKRIVEYLDGMGGAVASAAFGIFDPLYDAFVSALNRIIRAWNGLRFPGFSGPLGFSFGGMGVPQIQELATGGVITRPTLAIVGETAKARPEIVTPEGLMRQVFADELARQSKPTHVEQHFHNATVDPWEASRALAWTLRTGG